jgi:hypothetical protein
VRKTLLGIFFLALPTLAQRIPGVVQQDIATGQWHFVSPDGRVDAPAGVLPFLGVPTGACTNTQLAINSANGILYTCNGGTWVVSAGQLALPSLDTAGLIGEYLMVDGSTTQFKDSSAAGNTANFNGGGCTVAPTALGAPGFGYSFTAASTQCGSFSANLNAAKTIMVAVRVSSANVAAGGNYLITGSTGTNSESIYFIQGSATGNRVLVEDASNTAGGTVGNQDLTNVDLDGTFILTFTCDTNDHWYFTANGQTVEPWYFNQGNGCIPQAGANVYDVGCQGVTACGDLPPEN